MPVDGIGTPVVEVDSGPAVEIVVEAGREIVRLQKKDKAVNVVKPVKPVKQQQRVNVDGDNIERVVEAEAGGEAEPEADDEGEGEVEVENVLCGLEDGIAG